MSAVSFAPVCVGHTDFPLKTPGPCPDLNLPLPAASGSPFRLLDGPPYANGPLHLGHVLNKQLKDLAARAHAALGHPVEWTPRWDCHGLPVELNVERTGVSRADPSSFVPAARAYALAQMKAQRTTFQTLGLCASWDQAVCTMAPPQQAATLRALADLAQAGRLDVRHRPTPWCPACRSTVAGAEQETQLAPRTCAVVPFFFDDQTAVLSWTTTPWTLPTHAGLVVHPEATYQAFEWQGRRAWVASAAWDRVAQWYPGAAWVGPTCLGKDLAGRSYTTAWAAAHALVTDPGVLAEAGTGCLHAVPAFDLFDAEVGQLQGWATVQVLDEAGRFNDQAWPPLRGLLAGEAANAAVLEHLNRLPAVAHWLKSWVDTVTVSTCARHKAPLLMRPSRQVFLVLGAQVRDRAKAMVADMAFEPAAAQGRLLHQMANRPDWCLSRQRTWGVPLALVLDPGTGQPHAQAAQVMRVVAQAVETEGVEAWWRAPLSRWTEGLGLDPAQLTRVDDVLDVWFDSGALAVHQGGPSDLVVEGHDQLRGWFQACVWVASALDRPAPFKRVVTHGFVVDENGHKLSKSAGGDRPSRGVPGWSTLPADVVRLWAAMGEMGADRPWSRETVGAAQQAYARLRNTLRFALANVSPPAWAARPVPPTDHWAHWDVADWHATHAVRQEVLASVSKGLFEPAVRAALDHADQVLSRGLYTRLKDRLYCAPFGSPARRAAEEALRAVAGVWVDVLAVLTPQLVVEAWPGGARPDLGDPPGAWSESPWVAQARQARAAVRAAWEPQGWKGGLDRARWVGALSAPTAWEGEEALGVGQWVPAATPPAEAVRVDTPWGVGWLSPSPDPTCPRCRRPAPLSEGDSVCGCCHGVAKGSLTWRP